ncbi:MAG: hypothetical protein GY847_24070 [Proteobacteria bacterium]|nr:hypothetical protein [Pseudomonadota bacterium]
MKPDTGSTLVFGAATRLGAAVVQQLATDKEGGHSIIAVDRSSERTILGYLRSSLGSAAERVDVALYDPGKPELGLDSSVKQRIKDETSRIIHLAHIRDRTLAASEIRKHNLEVCTGILDFARAATYLESLIVVTDVGLTGDYPGCFSESWADVGQVPFDEVDRSSLEVEVACLGASGLPIVRARVGLLSDIDGLSPSTWRSAAEVLLPSIRYLRRLPRFLGIPSAVAKGSLAPLTPTKWAAQALVHLSQNSRAPGNAVHLVSAPPPMMEEVLASLTHQVGGAKLRGGLPIGLIEHIGKIPGLTKAAKQQADHVASWWTPHRYCLSRNELDTFWLKSLLPETLFPPLWREIETVFFRYFS